MLKGYVERYLILLVEDNSAHAELIMRAFASQKFPNIIQHVDNGKDALDYLFHRGRFLDEKKYPRPFLILLDLRLPLVDGIEVLKKCKADEEIRSIPIVVLTTSNSEKDVELAYENKANSYLVKPGDFENLGALLSSVSNYWLERNEQPQMPGDFDLSLF